MVGTSGVLLVGVRHDDRCEGGVFACQFGMLACEFLAIIRTLQSRLTCYCNPSVGTLVNTLAVASKARITLQQSILNHTSRS